jgi:RimJ/RimL family protein N-acetyltransferase
LNTRLRARPSPGSVDDVFEALKTDRLLIRPFRPEDALGLHRRRNDPRVAEYQTWTLPYPMDKAEEVVGEVVGVDGPTVDEWWMAIIEDGVTGEVHGDLALHLTWNGRTAEVGYTLDSGSWGRGYATEAVDALVGYLFETLGVTRVSGMLHPENRASAMVLERTGFLFEGHTRLSFWVGDEVSDDHIYGMTRADWDEWHNRPRSRPDNVSLVPVTLENERSVLELRTHKSQEAFVAPMLNSYADALFPEVIDGAPVVPWMRAIEADGVICGFVMVAVTTEHHAEPYLWRLLIDRLHQRRGIASMALDLLEDELRAMGDATMLVSWTPGRGTPEPLYLRRGFVPTGEVVDGETMARKAL